jgi:hypothetical protein
MPRVAAGLIAALVLSAVNARFPQRGSQPAA